MTRKPHLTRVGLSCFFAFLTVESFRFCYYAAHESSIYTYDFATQILASRNFFERSTSVLEETDSLFRPREKMMTVAQQVAHAVQTLDRFIDGVTRPGGFDLNFEEQNKTWREMKSLVKARTAFAAACARAVEFLRSKTPEELTHPLPP